VDLPRSFTIRASSHRIHNPLTSEKLATLGQAVSPAPRTAMLDLACATGEMHANPHDELVGDMRAELTAAPVRHARYRREYLGWSVFALMDR
jgi:hypothetical protein